MSYRKAADQSSIYLDDLIEAAQKVLDNVITGRGTTYNYCKVCGVLGEQGYHGDCVIADLEKALEALD